VPSLERVTHDTVRLTAGQALVRYLAGQWSERDGTRRRAVPGIFGIFGHGNVCGLGPALEEEPGRELAFHQPKNEQSMVHAAIGYARASNLLATMACSASIGPGEAHLARHLEPVLAPANGLFEWLSDGDAALLARFLDSLAALKEHAAAATPGPEPERAGEPYSPALLM
jgi:TPP-dependent trihydroxycyclohexane-1,2-dione (THcHDO) dehydratase